MTGEVVDLDGVRDLLIPQRGEIDERGVSRLARDWWSAYEARRAAEREAESENDRRSRVLLETKAAKRIAGSRRAYRRKVEATG